MNVFKNKIFWIITGVVVFLVLLVTVLLIVFTSGGGNSVSEDAFADTNAEELYELNMDCIKVKVGKLVHDTEDNSFEVTVTMPDYTKLYKEVYKSPNPEAELVQRLRSGDYKKKTIKSMAEAEYKNGKEVANTEKLVKFLLEKELIEATNAVWREKY